MRLKEKSPNVKFIQQLSCIAPNYFKKIYSDIQNQKIYEFNLSIIQEQELNRNNKIQIDPIISDKYGIPKIILNWTLSENFKLSKNKILENFSSFLIDNDLGRVALNSDYEENKDLTVGFHQLGGTRMGNNKNDSVVDRNLLVHGFENLYISGSSTFRTGGIAFPTLTIVALSCRLGDSITKIMNLKYKDFKYLEKLIDNFSNNKNNKLSYPLLDDAFSNEGYYFWDKSIVK